MLRFDEVHDAAGDVRPHWRRLERDLLSADGATLLRAQDRVRRLRRNQGTLPESPDAGLRALDPIPHLLSAPDWAGLEAGLRQRARLLDLLLADVYGPRHLVTRGAIGDDLEQVAEAVNLTYFAHVPVQPVDLLFGGTEP